MATIVFKDLKCEHYKSIRDIFLETFEESDLVMLGSSWKERTKEKSIGAFTREGDLLGFIIITGTYVDYLAVHPLFQKLKLGTKLLRYSLDRCIEEGGHLYLDYPIGRTDVRDWYIRNGFSLTSLKGRIGLVFHTYKTRSTS
jgi:GNAT superfamily N-acetyltransferase